MKRIFVLFALLSLMLTGCAGWHRVATYPTPRQSNVSEYDAYVRRRSGELTAGGKNSSDAYVIADNEARRLYGERTDGGSTQSAHLTWTNDNSRSVSLAELDQTVAGMKQGQSKR